MGVLQETVVREGDVLAVVNGMAHREVAAALTARLRDQDVAPSFQGRVIYFRSGAIFEHVSGSMKMVAEIVGEVVGRPGFMSDFLGSLSPAQDHEKARRKAAKASNARDRGAKRRPPVQPN